MSDFYVGQKVVCVDDSDQGTRQFHNITAGGIYTVRSIQIDPLDGEPSLFLEGIIRWHPHGFDRGYFPSRFRPIEYKAMELFRAIAANPNIKIREKA